MINFYISLLMYTISVFLVGLYIGEACARDRMERKIKRLINRLKGANHD